MIPRPATRPRRAGTAGSTFIIVLWIAFGLVSLTLYFAHTTSLELRAADQRVAGIAAEQAIEAGARYVASVLMNSQTNGIVPDPASFLCEAVVIGKSGADESEPRFWLIGRDTNSAALGHVGWGLVDEASKLNLNSAASNTLVWLPGMTEDLAGAIVEWRDTNGGSGTYDLDYSLRQPSYMNKAAAFETVEELRMVYGADMDVIVGEDANRNSVLDPNETDQNRNGLAEPGILDYVTVYSREPNTYSNGTARVSITQIGATGPFAELLNSVLGSSRSGEILSRLGVQANGGGPGAGGPPASGGAGGGAGTGGQFTSPLQLYRQSGMTPEEFEKIEGALTTTTNSWIEGRVNINTASAAVLSCLPGLNESPGLAETLISYREQNPNSIRSIAWIAEALGSGNDSVLQALAAEDCLTTHSYQFTADIAAVGPYGRGYRRTRFVFDTTTGSANIIYRQDLTHLGWALGKELRQQLLAKETR